MGVPHAGDISVHARGRTNTGTDTSVKARGLKRSRRKSAHVRTQVMENSEQKRTWDGKDHALASKQGLLEVVDTAGPACEACHHRFVLISDLRGRSRCRQQLSRANQVVNSATTWSAGGKCFMSLLQPGNKGSGYSTHVHSSGRTKQSQSGPRTRMHIPGHCRQSAATPGLPLPAQWPRGHPGTCQCIGQRKTAVMALSSTMCAPQRHHLPKKNAIPVQNSASRA